ncbi:winged helix DNA-binding domain-containing protein [Actinotalea sp. Marseille-Q4924]|uniref:winged helix DNA-binding domain-containing protein n=1 Tax=Actinotalea sp. Marseille-Q4924 TaxID=2866571 RepID=UPI001CE49DCD|nr:winged helix DNA-binding domain-containing protein [Actinotalea sp. Marseille-Q4924]
MPDRPPPTTAHDVALLRLVAQRLAGPRAGTPREAVAHLTAVQSQDLPGALRSVALRTGSTVADVVRAVDGGEVVRTWPMRGTLHLVDSRDALWMVPLMAGRPRAAAAQRRGQLGLTDEHVEKAGVVLTAALTGGAGLSRQEVLALWTDAGLPTAQGAGYHLLAFLAQTGVVCLGPFRAGEQVFVLTAEWVRDPRVLGRDLDEEEALAEIALRYAQGHGPSSVQDLARWTGLPLGHVRRGLASVAEQLSTLELDGRVLHVAPELLDAFPAHREDARRTMLLPGFDEIVLGYADRSVTVAPEHADRIVPGGNGVFRPTVLHDGRAVGVWRVVGSGKRRRVEAEPFGRWPRGVAAEVERLGASVVDEGAATGGG